MLRTIVFVSLLALAVPAAAHHGVSAYDMDTVETLEGRVTGWHWRSPHTGITLEVAGEAGPRTWEIEGAPLRWMKEQGFAADSLREGETVTITYHPARRRPRSGILMHVDRGDGDRLSVNRPEWLGGP